MKETKINIFKNYYDAWNIYDKNEITLNAGFTVLVGCNGAGKTTLLYQIENYLEDTDINFIKYDNISDGGTHAMDSMMFHGDVDGFAAAFSSSEGEKIHQNIANLAKTIGAGISDAKEGQDFFILLDAVDSGLSIDNILDIKDFFKNILIPDYEKNTLGGNIYIIAVANEYEMANGEQCFDVQKCEYITFKDYEEYKKFILASREKKTKAIDKYYAKKDKMDRSLPFNREKGDEEDGTDE